MEVSPGSWACFARYNWRKSLILSRPMPSWLQPIFVDAPSCISLQIFIPMGWPGHVPRS